MRRTTPAGTLALLRRLLCFRRFSDEMRHVRRFLASLAALLAVLLVENLGTWVVSASDMHKHGYTPLQVRGRGWACGLASCAEICCLACGAFGGRWWGSSGGASGVDTFTPSMHTWDTQLGYTALISCPMGHAGTLASPVINIVVCCRARRTMPSSCWTGLPGGGQGQHVPCSAGASTLCSYSSPSLHSACLFSGTRCALVHLCLSYGIRI